MRQNAGKGPEVYPDLLIGAIPGDVPLLLALVARAVVRATAKSSCGATSSGLVAAVTRLIG